MPLSEAKKRANRKWDSANLTNISIKVKKDYYERVKKATAEAGTTPAAIMRKAIDDFMQNHQGTTEE